MNEHKPPGTDALNAPDFGAEGATNQEQPPTDSVETVKHVNGHGARRTDAELLAMAPTWITYANRIGATTQKNFRRFVKEADDEHKYGNKWKATVTVTVDGDGEVHCYSKEKSKEHEPTDAEKAAIKAEIAAAGWPKSILATAAAVKFFTHDLRREIGEPTLFVFRARTGEDAIFVQQRIDNDRGKFYLPWTLWSDGQWRKMEPDGKLPLFGLDQLASGKPAMIHEGAKAAAAAQKIAEDKSSAHPWASELRDYVHLGWPAGANNPGHVDWSPLKNLAQGRNVVFVCDNDQIGVNVAVAISRELRRKMSVVEFDDRFNRGFDLANDWPRLKEWWKGDRYIGPTMKDMMGSTTWATEEVKTGDKGRPTYVIRNDFAAEWCYTPDALFVHRDHASRILREAEFNRLVRSFSDAEDTGRLLAKVPSSQVAGISYSPNMKPGVYSVGGLRFFNSYRSPDIKPIVGDQSPWIEFLDHLIPDETDRNNLKKICATLISRPDVKITYGVLLVSEEQGVGKGTLGEKILTPLVGLDNTSSPSEHDIVESQFNYWSSHTRLAVVHEIYAGQSSKAYHKLKSIITDKNITVNKKNQAAYRIDNWLFILACSNSNKALQIAAEDRRWFIPRVTDQMKDQAYWNKLNAWLTDGDGLGIIKKWADDYVEKFDAVATGAHAPSSKTKKKMIRAGFSPAMRMVEELGEAATENKKNPIMFTDEDAMFWLAIKMNKDVNDLKVSSATIRKMLGKIGGMTEMGEKKIKGHRIYVFVNSLIKPEDWEKIWDDRKTTNKVQTDQGELELLTSPTKVMDASDNKKDDGDTDKGRSKATDIADDGKPRNDDPM